MTDRDSCSLATAISPAPRPSLVLRSGDLNARPENVNLEELLASIKAEWTKLGPLIGLEVVPQGSRTEVGLTVGSRRIERDQRSRT
jgi:hypothetical protein